VPPFSSDEARDILASELGVQVSRLGDIFSDLSHEPIASASIGQARTLPRRHRHGHAPRGGSPVSTWRQVYKGTLPDGRVVAVKVQRPGILSEIALDLYILRLLAPVTAIRVITARRRRVMNS